MLRLGGKAVIVAACALIDSLVLAGVAHAKTSTPSPLAVPAAPSNLHWDDGFGPPGLHWTSHSVNEDGFRLQKMTTVGWLTVATYPARATSGQSPVFSHDDYCDNVRIGLVAFNAAGESAPSNAIQLPPLPSGCRSAATPTYTNDSGRVADTLTIDRVVGPQGIRVTANAPGCAEPVITVHPPPNYDSVVLTWPDPCVDSGESVSLEIDLVSPDSLGHATRSLEGATPSPTPGPTIAPSPSPTVTPAALPRAGGAPGSDPDSGAILVVGVILILGGSLALKRIR
jgi:hypothetical protein